MFPAVADDHVLRFDADARARCDAAGDEYVGSNHGTFTDDGFAAEDGGAGINRDIILNRGMTFSAAQALTAAGRKCADGHALIHFHVFADDRGLADEYLPIVAPGWISMPVLLWAYSVMMRGISGTFSL